RFRTSSINADKSLWASGDRGSSGSMVIVMSGNSPKSVGLLTCAFFPFRRPQRDAESQRLIETWLEVSGVFGGKPIRVNIIRRWQEGTKAGTEAYPHTTEP